MNRGKIVSLITILIFINSCNKSLNESNNDELFNRMWILESFEIFGIIDIPPTDQVYSIQFNENNKLTGKNDCNDIFGSFNLNLEMITIDSLISTEIYCGKESLDSYYTEALRIAQSYKIDKNQLFIYYGTTGKLKFNGE